MFLVSRGGSHGRTLEAAAVTNNLSASFVTSDGLLTVAAWGNSNATTAANLGQGGDWLGVVNGNPSAVDGTEAITLQFEAGAGLFRMGHRWTRSRVILSGFESDPGFTDLSGHAADVSYANGTLSYFYPWDDGVEHVFAFSNPGASEGRTLRLNVHDTAPGWQATVTRIDYTVNGATPAVANLTAVHQTIDNFGASDAWSMQNVGLWSDASRSQIADLLFTTHHGIGLSAWRFNLAAGLDPAVHSGSVWQRWRTEEGFLTSANQYDWTRQAGQRWFLSAARARGVDQFIAMVYSPPTNFTRNGHVYCTDGVGSSNLKPGYEGAFAGYIADVLAHFKTNVLESERVSFDWVMPVNEPYWEWNSNSQEGARHSNSDIIAQVQALRTALDQRGLETEIVLGEAGDLPGLYSLREDISTKYGSPYGDYLSAFSSIANLLSRNISAHSYFTDNPTNQLIPIRQTLRAELAARPHWRYWQTEYCILGAAGPKRDLTMATALNVARVIWADLAVADASAWHWWLSLSQADYKDGLLYTDFWEPGDAETLYCSKNFWAFGQWSRFVRPGWRRVELPGHEDVSGLMGAAFIDPATNAVAILSINHSTERRLVAPEVTGLPAGRAVAFWSPWITSAAPSDNLSALPPVAPGDSCVVPSHSVLTLVARVMNSSTTTEPVISGLRSTTVRAGETAAVEFTVADSNIPANLLRVTVQSGNPNFLPQSSIRLNRLWETNGLTRELFVSFSGSNLSHLAAAPRFPNAPHATHTVNSFETPQNLGGIYGTRLRGWVVPPQTGNYTFWIASRDASELYLSSDDNPVGKTRIALVSEATEPREWTKTTAQQSAPVHLESGKRYYIEAVHVAANGGDHLSVGWQLPDQTLERPIPGSRLSPWSDPFAASTRHLLTLVPGTNSTGSGEVVVIAADTLGRSATNRFNVTVLPAMSLAPTNLTARIADGELKLSWPADHLGWVLEAQTNPLTLGLGRTWSRLPGSEETNAWATAIDPKNPVVFYRLSTP